MGLKSVSLLPGDKALELTWADGEQARFSTIWLRDNSLDPKPAAKPMGSA